MSAALSVLMTQNFSKMLLRARRALEFSHGLDPSATSAALPAWLAAISWWAAHRIADGTFLREHGGLEGVQLGTAARLGVPLCPPAQNSVAWRDALGERS